ncbi:phosphoglucomutase [Solibacillus silvestris]|nr:phospho-sugar mutase [Solibacillus silvestris]OBW58425.1 phosphoglucomutase [Solibacillus silvestris]
MITIKNQLEQWQSAKLPDNLKQELDRICTDERVVEEHFYQNVKFGTGGMRGLLGVGTNRMNIYTVRRAAAGLSQYICEGGEEAKTRGVVIAYDTRHFSKEFAVETAKVLGAYGVHSYVFSESRPTPELSFAVRYLYAYAGVVITASHNPKQYNGFKVYGADGAQLVPAGADAIVSYMDKIEDIFAIETAEFEQYGQYILEKIDQAYQTSLLQLKEQPVKSNMKLVYTPLHGAGLVSVCEGLKAFGFDEVHVVEAQGIQDGEFPTVPYPNPEEAAAFEMAMELGHQVGAELLLATDPDADRLGVAVRKGQSYELLTGNQLGALLLNYILQTKQSNGTLPENGVMIKTIVTSELGAKIAAYYGVETINTLTGFKYIAEKIAEYEQSGAYKYIFGYEESYGYLIEPFVRDKDAVQVALKVAEMASFYESQGKTLLDALEDMYKQFGYYKEALISKVFEGKSGQEEMAALLDTVRQNPSVEIAGKKVVLYEDYLTATATAIMGDKLPIDLPKENVLKFILEDESWIAIRPSGTEPKCKYYFGVTGESASQAAERLEQLKLSFI